MAIVRDEGIAQDECAAAPVDRLLDRSVAVDAMSFLKDQVFLFEALAALDQESHLHGFHGEQGHSSAAHLDDAAVALEQKQFTARRVGQMEDAADARCLFVDIADFAW